MKRPLFLLAAALVLAAVAAGITLYYWPGKPLTGYSGPPPSLLSLLPPSAPCIVYIDLAVLRASPLLAQLTPILPAPGDDPEYARFVRETGFDYTRDLDQVAVAFWPAPPAQRVVALADGRFAREKISRYALASGKLEKRGDRDVYVVPAAKGGAPISFSFLSPNRVALAQGKGLESAGLEARPGAFAPEMGERIVRVSGSAFFIVARADQFSFPLGPSGIGSAELDRLLHSIRWLTLAGRPESERLKVAAEAECDNAGNARELALTLEGLRLLASAGIADARARHQLTPQAAALLDRLARSATISRADRRVSLQLELTTEVLRTMSGANAPAAAKH
jgi:hypothetical protein